MGGGQGSRSGESTYLSLKWSNPGVDTICGLSLLFALSFAPRGLSPSTLVFFSPQKPTFSNPNSTRSGRRRGTINISAYPNFQHN